MSDKQYLSAQGLLEDSWKLAEQILKSDFRPTFMIAVWRGGVPIGIAVQEYLSYHGIDTDNIAIRTSSYQGIDQQARQVAVHGLGYLVKNIQHSDSLLIVDDVFDSGRSIEAIVNELTRLARRNTPHDIRIAVPYFKPARNRTNRVPDYYLYETDAWLKYPHSLEGLSTEEIRDNRPELYNIIKDCLPPTPS
ncbi:MULTISPECIES: phosphoribosyltransferase [Thalassolituus]|uniref:Hypoxanthine-guanine phosphoribosyltransferase n=2 Tax=root TaxID=1 RepID=A0A160TD37_9ZZZZ|nr:phosphoribosyltransferase family protein [Thalassolituus oleivorans]AHK15577.1 hypoxanthine phosphoribosyltransferase [Thalassolituus oleivorans R6-15]MCA6128991.1 hypoxanthine phosphoribosyltransferase [Thalassolituus oleivorans 4BN06-13]CCU72569.1 putative hypoxanthine-guanine phosphoribosyltransferase [Thalassolituus oleivorans MIL-1]